MKTTRLKVEGTHCGSCWMLVDMSLEEIDGVHEVSSDTAAGVTEVTFDEAAIDEAKLIAAIEGAGYTAAVEA